MRPLKVAVVGCGRMGCFTSDSFRAKASPGWLPLNHAEAVQSVEGLHLHALCDVNEDSLQHAAREYGVTACYGDYKEMILKESPDILTVATRTPGRTDLLCFAAENGVKAIHIEKPLAQNLASCLQTVESLKKNNVAISHGTYRRYHGLYRQALDKLEDGTIGQLQEITIEMGRSMLLWCHPHSIDLILMFARHSKPEIVMGDCLINSLEKSSIIIDEDPIVLHGYIRFECGLTATITQAGGLNLRMGTERGTLSILRDGYEMNYYSEDRVGGEIFSAFSGESGTQLALMELRDSICKKAPTSFSVDDLEMNTRLLLSIAYSSVKGGKPIAPETLPPEFTVTGCFNGMYA